MSRVGYRAVILTNVKTTQALQTGRRSYSLAWVIVSAVMVENCGYLLLRKMANGV